LAQFFLLPPYRTLPYPLRSRHSRKELVKLHFKLIYSRCRTRRPRLKALMALKSTILNYENFRFSIPLGSVREIVCYKVRLFFFSCIY
jgi:hypothetical protein